MAKLATAKGLKPFARKGLQVRILPPLPTSSQYRAYVYLLGIYLGDGCLAWTGRTFRLLIYLNVSQSEVIQECVDAVTILVPERRVGLVRHGARRVAVSSYARAWRELFPQHGPGRKHTRRIELSAWQRGLADLYPAALVRGLIQSDAAATAASSMEPTIPRIRSPTGRTTSSGCLPGAAI